MYLCVLPFQSALLKTSDKYRYGMVLKKKSTHTLYYTKHKKEEKCYTFEKTSCAITHLGETKCFIDGIPRLTL